MVSCLQMATKWWIIVIKVLTVKLNYDFQKMETYSQEAGSSKEPEKSRFSTESVKNLYFLGIRMSNYRKTVILRFQPGAF